MNLKDSIILIFLVGFLDFAWISLNMPMYRNNYSLVQGSPMNINILAAIGAYIFVFILMAYIAIPLAKKTDQTFINVARTSGLLGLCIYGIYNATNVATFKRYSIKSALLDTVWGGILFSVVPYIFLKLQK